MTTYGDMYLGQHWLIQSLVVCGHKAITWTNVDLSSNVLWHSPESNFTRSTHELSPQDVNGDYTFISPTHPLTYGKLSAFTGQLKWYISCQYLGVENHKYRRSQQILHFQNATNPWCHLIDDEPKWLHGHPPAATMNWLNQYSLKQHISGHSTQHYWSQICH